MKCRPAVGRKSYSPSVTAAWRETPVNVNVRPRTWAVASPAERQPPGSGCPVTRQRLTSACYRRITRCNPAVAELDVSQLINVGGLLANKPVGRHIICQVANLP